MSAAVAPPDDVQSCGRRFQLLLSAAGRRRLRLAAAPETAEPERVHSVVPFSVQLHPDAAVFVGRTVQPAAAQQQLHPSVAAAEEDAVVADAHEALVRRHQSGVRAAGESGKGRRVPAEPLPVPRQPGEPPAGAAERSPEAAQSRQEGGAVHQAPVADGDPHHH